MTKKPRIIDNNEGNERGCRPDRPKKNRSDVRLRHIYDKDRIVN